LVLLTSSGIREGKVFTELSGYIESNMKRAVIITTASVGYKERDWNIPRHTEDLQRLGLTVDLLDIEYEEAKLLLSYDVVLINGGNPFYLLYHLRQSRCFEILSRLLGLGKIIIGVSAGSIVLGTTVALIHELDPTQNEEAGLTQFDGLGLVSLNICPHVSRFAAMRPDFLSRIADFEERSGVRITRVEDGEGIFVF